MIDYARMNAELPKLKRALTIAQRYGTPAEILRECHRAFDVFDASGYPDCWSRWERAREDAVRELARDRYAG